MFQRAKPASTRPSRQTLGLARVKCEACLGTQSRFIEALQSVASRCIGSLSGTCVAAARAVRPLAASEPSHRANVSCSIGSGCPSCGGQRIGGSARKTCTGQTGVCSAAVPSLGRRMNRSLSSNSPSRALTREANTNTNTGLGSHSAVGTGALVAQAAKQVKIRARSVRSHARPNPSVEGTSSSGLRPPPAAPHVER